VDQRGLPFWIDLRIGSQEHDRGFTGVTILCKGDIVRLAKSCAVAAITAIISAVSSVTVTVTAIAPVSSVARILTTVSSVARILTTVSSVARILIVSSVARILIVVSISRIRIVVSISWILIVVSISWIVTVIMVVVVAVATITSLSSPFSWIANVIVVVTVAAIIGTVTGRIVISGTGRVGNTGWMGNRRAGRVGNAGRTGWVATIPALCTQVLSRTFVMTVIGLGNLAVL
jgi:hypothetical protein